MLERVKNVLGITDPEFNDEIQDLIDAAKMDLGIAGITRAEITEDPLIRRGIMLYCKTHFHEGTDDSERLEKAYDKLKGQLMNATGYTDWTGDGEA